MNRPENAGARAVALSGRIVWALLMLAAAFAAIGLEFDREARRRPGFADLVPPVLRHFAHFDIASRAIAGGDNERGLAAAMRLVAVRPIPAENLSLLALAFQQNRLGEQSARALSLSASRGWREPLAQRAAAEAAAGMGDWSTAFLRIAAVWSIGHRDADTIGVLRQISAAPAGRSEIARWLRDSRRWRDEYAVWGSEKLEPQTHAKAVALAISDGTDFACRSLAQASTKLLRRGYAAEANSTWPRHCHGDAHETAESFAFVPAGRGWDAGPFGWQPEGSSHFRRVEAVTDGSWRLDYENSVPGYRPIASRLSGLKPGKYTLAVRGERTKGEAALPLRLRLSCIARDGEPTHGVTVGIIEAPLSIEVPGDACGVQHFQLEAPSGAGAVTGLTLAPAGWSG